MSFLTCLVWAIVWRRVNDYFGCGVFIVGLCFNVLYVIYSIRCVLVVSDW